MMEEIPGNRTCVDCGNWNPDWASISYGTLMCLNCSGRHRSYGVKTSFVRSINMDSWDYKQVLTMLEGGNDQLRKFFARHRMAIDDNIQSNYTSDELTTTMAIIPRSSTSILSRRYHTKAAKFCRDHLMMHFLTVASGAMSGTPYRGREANRRNNGRGDITTNKGNNCKAVELRDDATETWKLGHPPSEYTGTAIFKSYRKHTEIVVE